MNHYFYSIFFFNDPAPTEISTLSLHDALPILAGFLEAARDAGATTYLEVVSATAADELRSAETATRVHPDYLIGGDRKSTRLNSSHVSISYAVFCLKKKKIITYHTLVGAS